jgi:YggT family protein
MIGNPYISNATTYLIDVLLGLLLLIVVLRFMLQWVRADFRNPIGQFIIRFTNPMLNPLRQVIPGRGTIDIACGILAFILAFVKIWLITAISKFSFAISGLLLYTLADLLKLVIYIFMGAVIIRIIASWIAPQGSYNPLMSAVYALSEPVMAPARKLIPPLGGLDLSPIAVFIFLNLTIMLVIQPIVDLAQRLM